MKVFYKLSLLAIGLFLTGRVTAQQDTTGSFNLERCIEYAIQNSISGQNATLDKQIAAAKVKETIGIGLPQISASGSVVHNPKLQRFFTTYLDAAHSNGPSFIPADAAAQLGVQNGDVVGVKNFFQLQSSGTASLTANQLLFNGSYLVGLKASKTYKELATRNANATKEQIIIQVSKAYYAVIINKERINLFTDNIGRVDSLLKNTKALNENGLAESIDVDRIQVSLNNLTAERDKFLNLNDLGLELLKFQMNYPMDRTIRVEGNIQDVRVETNPAVYQQDWDYRLRPDYQVLETNRKLQELNIRNKYATGMPTMSAFGTLGYSTQSPNIQGLFKTNTKINDSGGLGPDKWYSFSQIGLSLNIPIFSGGQRHYQVQQEKLNLLKIMNGYKSLKNGIDLEVKQSTVNFENALKSLSVQHANMDLAGRVAHVTKIKYEQGVGSNLEVVDAENSLRIAQTNYYNALYDAMIAKVDMDKAFGKILPNSPAQ
jgi:outer membrane protein TolC